MKQLVLFLLFFSSSTFAQKSQIFHIDSLPTEGVLLDKGWKFHTGDNPDWAKAGFDDSAWKPIDPTKDIAALPEIFNAQIKWLRLDFEVKNKLPNPLGIAINQAGASEIYLNGHLNHQFGHFDTDSTKVKAYDPLEYPIHFPIDSVRQYHLAVRYALQPNIRYTNIFELTQNRLFKATLLNLVPTLNAQRDFRVYFVGVDMFKIGVFFMLFVLHLAFYFYQRSNKTHLVLAMCFLLLTMLSIFKIIGQNQFLVEYRYFNLNISNWSYLIGVCMLVSAFYRMAKVRLDNYYYAYIVLTFLSMFVLSLTYGGIPWLPILFFIGNIFSFVIMFRLTRIGLKKEIKGFWILGVAVMIAFFGVVFLAVAILFLKFSLSLITGYKILDYAIPPYLFEVVVNIGTISIPLGLSLFMGIEGNETNKALSKQLVENDQLKNEAIEHEQEKQHILATQNETLEKQVTQRTAELELKNRDLEIEAALERVRSRTMAMQKSKELSEVSYLLNKQVVELGIPTWGCAFNIYNENDSTEWFSNLEGTIPAYNTPRENISLKYYEAGQRGESLLIEEFGGERIKELYRYFASLNDSGDETINNHLANTPDYQINHMAYFKYGYLLFVTLVPSPDAHEIFVRFAKEFEQTYTRFLDLQKAEEQTREAQIQLSLERIRAKAMAMQRTDELSDFLTVLFEQFEVLNLNPVNSQLSLLDIENNRSTFRLTGKKGAALIATQEIDLDASPVWKQKVDELKAGHPNDVDVIYIPFENLPEIAEIFKEILEKFPADECPLPEDYPNGQYVIEGYCKYGYLGYSASRPPSEEEKEITRRIANEFGNVYQRFLDLQKAEAQAREAQIQLSLERIRAKAMSMQHSDELSDFLTVLFEQFEVLNLNPIYCNLTFFDIDNNRSTYRMTGKKGSTLIATQEIDMDASTVWQQEIEEWKEGRPNEVDVLYIPFENIPEIAEIFKEILEKLPEDERPLPEDFPNGQYVIQGYCKYGYLGYSASQPPSDEEKEITRRIATEFGNVYQRFLDLQKAEAQAREAQIEVTLERVRSRTMAMQHSKELAEIASLLFKQVIGLGVNAFAITFQFWLEDGISTTCWTSVGLGGGMQPSFRMPHTEEPFHHQIYKAWKKGEDFFVMETKGEELEDVYRYVAMQMDEEVINKMENSDFSIPKFQVVHCVFFLQGYIMFMTYERIPDAHDIFKRFGRVFEQTYTRFLDLQKAEIQAKEAIIEASLERVRAEIASMRTTEDLQYITPLIWKELTTLKVPFTRCGVFIMDEGIEKIHTYLSTPDGKAIASFHLPYDSEGNTPQIVAHWRHQDIFFDEWDETQFQTWGKSLVNQGIIQSSESYATSALPKRLCLHFIPFLQGMLYVGNESPLIADEIQVVQSLSNAFSNAYARYEDFNQLEEAKRQVDNTLKELKSTQAQLIQKEKLASLGELTAGIAHEIQNPLNFVNNFSELSVDLVKDLREEIEKPTQDKAYIGELFDDLSQNQEKINHHGKRASSIVKGMLEHSRASTGVKELTDINKLADEYLRLSYHGLRAKDKDFNADFTTDFDVNLPKVEVIPQDIGRVILNLINNAFYAVNEKMKQNTEGGYKPTVTVSTQQFDNQVIIKVKDNGTGMPESVRAKVFQPFFTTKPTGSGTGLGLSLAYDIVTKGHGGTLEVESTEGVGTEFLIKLPF